MSRFTALKALVTSKAGLTLLHGKKHAPVILFTAGVVGMVTTVVLASRATMKLDTVLDALEEDLAVLEEGRGKVIVGNREIEESQAKVLLYTKATINIARLYAPAIGVGVLSIAALTGSHFILTQRNTALMAAYGILQKGFDKYRNRVREELGEEQDQKFLYGAEERAIVEETEEGPVVKMIKEASQGDLHLYDKFFDELNDNFDRRAERNAFFLRNAQNWSNDKLKAQGYLYLNDVYGFLGIPITQAGQVVGWVIKDGNQNFVDFGIFDHRNPSARRFLNGYEDAVRLQFNVDGVVLDQIGKKR
jgi:hypothetical protein